MTIPTKPKKQAKVPKLDLEKHVLTNSAHKEQITEVNTARNRLAKIASESKKKLQEQWIQ
eukprot:CAMPEP_0116883626 /NCGR_PEP_ID=MMETSP0463-20121206/16178_1 /TAXON_ID=181622 /ORGANISM="Strombidinopsis sp, Strain SopsisLIS2011" /LENGTH=59 /DNA_ID=CAMNT_0004538639 /DNA_START=107 /DNA_END=286 /DNA_ORIENTATION=-